MGEVVVKHNVKYQPTRDSTLSLDIYYPPNLKSRSKLPAVIFVFGYSDSKMIEMTGSKLKDFGQYLSWGQLTAASGLIAITYETNQPSFDIHKLIRFIRQNATSLKIDKNRIGIWACSGNVPTALSVLMRGSRDFLKCAVFYYGFMLDWNNSHIVAEAARQVGFVYPGETMTIDDLPQTVPIFIVRAGREQTPNLNETIDYFLNEAIARNLPITFVNYSEGQHAFDILDDTETSHKIIKQTLGFMQTHLNK